jgi:hypothetical protein
MPVNHEIDGWSDSDVAAEELESTFQQIADQLAALSEQEERPSGSGARFEPFESVDVDFASAGWLLRLLAVQDWLNLPEDIDQATAEEDPSGTATLLFKLLEVPAPASCVAVDDGLPRLTPAGAAALSGRLDVAVMMMERFVEARELVSSKAATQQWIEWWDEDSIATTSREPIRAETNVWPIQEFFGMANSERLNLSPSYQRGDVWSASLSQQLIISILRGIPLPSVILLKPQSAGVKAVYEVVDGKQRLTAILRFIGKHPLALKLVKEAQGLQTEIPFEETFNRDYRKFRRLWQTHRNEALNATKEAEYYFPFKLPSSGDVPDEKLRGKYYCEIHDVPVRIGANEETVRHVFENVSKYKVPVIEYIDTAPRQIHEVFHLYNKAGKHLNAEEIRNALFHHVDLMRLLLLASGDNPNVELLASYIPEEERPKLQDIGAAMSEYRFGTARYRRTKLLSWLTSLVVHPSLQDSGDLNVRSTAKQIHEALLAVESDNAHPLRTHENLIMLASDLHACVEAHSSSGAWAPQFKDDKDGNKWQELQLVASLVGVFVANAAVADVSDLLEEKHAEVFQYTSAHLRPEKTQNKTQWGFIGKVALGLLDVLEVDVNAAERALVGRYGASCIPTLTAAAKHYHHRKA